MKPIIKNSLLLLCIAANSNVGAQNLQLRKQTGTIPLPALATPKPIDRSSTTGDLLSPGKLFNKVSPSIVVIEADDGNGEFGRLLGTGSGVVIALSDPRANLIVTNCHVTDMDLDGIVGITQGQRTGAGMVVGKDMSRDLCTIRATLYQGKDTSHPVKLAAVQVGSSQWLNVGDKVYAIGAPQGLELTLSDGLVSGFRNYKGTEVIQTTAPISHGSSGGGLFDAQGRLVGITTMYLDDGQNLNFAVPAELIAHVLDFGRSNMRPVARAPDPLSSRTDRWLEVGGSNSFIAYVDTQTLLRHGSDVTVWVKFAYDNTETGPSGIFDQTLVLSTYNCNTRQVTDKSYSESYKGKLIYSNQYREYELKKYNLLPDSVGEKILIFVCNTH